MAPPPPGDTPPLPEHSGILSRLKHGSASRDRPTAEGPQATVSVFLFDDHYHLGSEDRDMHVVIDGYIEGTFYLISGGYAPRTHEMHIEVSPGYHEVWLEWRRHSSDSLRIEMRPGESYVLDAYTTYWRGKVNVSFRN